MALKPAILKDLERQLKDIGVTDEILPTVEDKQEFVAAQIHGMQKQAYRIIVDLEVARKFAAAKDDASNELAKERFGEGIASLKAIKPTINTLSEIGEALSKLAEEEAKAKAK